MSGHVFLWRRVDVDGMERLELDVGPDGVAAASTVLCADGGGCRLEHRWQLDRDWRAQSVTVDRWGANGHRCLRLDRVGSGWAVDGRARADLDLADEPDLSLTPFCNTLPIRRVPEAPGATLTLDTAFIDGDAMTVARSRQRYERTGPRTLRYVDLGLSRGFEADLVVDELGLVLAYEHLFERVAPRD